MNKISFLFCILICSSQLFSQENLTYQIKNISINSKHAEFGTKYLDSNTILFSSSMKNETDKSFKKGRRTNNRQQFLDLYIGNIDENGEIVNHRKFTNDANNKFADGDITLSADRKTAYFIWNNFYNTQRRLDSAKWKTKRLFKATISNNGEISNAEPMPFNSSNYSISNPFLSSDGKKLYFSSNMPSESKDFDLYVVDINLDGSYSKPKNLGTKINTDGNEIFPFVSKNNIIYFSSNGYKTRSNYDIYYSKLDNNEYSKPVNIGFPINSNYDDFAFVINEFNDAGYFSSTRKDGIGDVDIYYFSSQENEDCSQLITGILLNKSTNQIIANAKVNLYYKDEKVAETLSDSEGKYSFKLKCDANYQLKATSENYVSLSFDFATNSKNNKSVSQNLLLEPIDCNQLITGNIMSNISNEGVPNELILDATVSLYQDDRLINTINTKSNSNYTFDIKCSSNYRIVASKNGYIDFEHDFTSSTKNKEKITKNLVLEKEICNQVVTGVVLNKENNTVIQNASVILFVDNIKKETVKVTDKGSFTFKINCDETYKLTANAVEFMEDTYDFKTNNEDQKTITQNLLLEPISCNQTITGVVLNKEDNAFLNNATVTLFVDNIKKETVNVNEKGSYSFTINCDNSYKLIASANDFLEDTFVFKTNYEDLKTITQNLLLEPLSCNQTITGVVLNKENNAFLNNASVTLFVDNIKKETLKVNNKGSYSFTINCDNSYKIIASANDFLEDSFEFKTNHEDQKAITQNLLLEPLSCNQTITGVVLNKEDNAFLNNATVTLFVDNIKKETVNVNEKGSYSFTINCDNSYKLIASANDFLEDTFVFKTNYEDLKTITQNLLLEPLSCNQTITGVVLNKENNAFLNNASVTLFVDNIKKETLKVNNKGSYSFTINCDNSYKIIASANDFLEDSFEFKTNHEDQKAITQNLLLEPLSCNQTITGVVLNKEDNAFLNNASVTLFVDDIKKETVKVADNGSYSFTINCDNSYKITASANDFIEDSFEFKTNHEDQKAITQNLLLEPLSCNQTITGVVLNKEDNAFLNNASVTLFVDNIKKETVKVTDNGSYSFTINCDNSYKIIASANDFLEDSFEFKTSHENQKAITQNLLLEPLSCNQTITGVVLNKEDNAFLNNASVTLFVDDIKKETVKVADNGSFSFTINCDNSYKITASANDFIEDSFEFKTNHEDQKTFTQNLLLTPTVCNQIISGTILNKESNIILYNASVTLFEKNKKIKTLKVDTNGSYSFTINCDKSYKIIASAKGFTDEEYLFETNHVNQKSNTHKLSLEPVICNQTIAGIVLNKVTKQPLKDVKILFINSKKELKAVVSDLKGAFKFTATCNTNYEIIASLPDFENHSEIVETSTKNNSIIKKTIALIPIPKIVQKDKILVIETEPINFDLNSWEVTEDIAIQLNKVVAIMKFNPEIKINLNSHTDSRAPDAYNLNLTQNRANSCKDYLVNNGIESDRIFANGYGETKLLNKCSNGVKCTDTEHLLNKRTEFIIAKE